jgi:hypothetical protein
MNEIKIRLKNKNMIRTHIIEVSDYNSIKIRFRACLILQVLILCYVFIRVDEIRANEVVIKYRGGGAGGAGGAGGTTY